MLAKESQIFFSFGPHSVPLDRVETQARHFFSAAPDVVNIYFAENDPWPESAYKTTKKLYPRYNSYFLAIVQANRLREGFPLYSGRELERERARVVNHVQSSQAVGEGASVYSVAELLMIDRLEAEFGLVIESEYIPDVRFKEAQRVGQRIVGLEETILDAIIHGRLDRAIATTQNGFKEMAKWINGRDETITDELYQVVRNIGDRAFRMYVRLGADHDVIVAPFRERFIPEEIPNILQEYDADGSARRTYVERILLGLQQNPDATISTDEACRIILEKFIQIQLLSVARTREQVIIEVDKILERTEFEEIDSLLRKISADSVLLGPEQSLARNIPRFISSKIF